MCYPTAVANPDGDAGAPRVTRDVDVAAVGDLLEHPPWAVLLRIATKYYLPPRALLVELRHLRKLYYGQVQDGFGYIRVVPTACEFLTRL